MRGVGKPLAKMGGRCYVLHMETDNIVLEHLRAIRANVDELRDDMREVKGRLGILEAQYASLSNRVDRIDERTIRIERRLELVPAE